MLSDCQMTSKASLLRLAGLMQRLHGASSRARSTSAPASKARLFPQATASKSAQRVLLELQQGSHLSLV